MAVLGVAGLGAAVRTWRKVRDPRHDVCADRQTWHAMTHFVAGWLLAGVLEWLRVPVWLIVVVLVVGLTTVPGVQLVLDEAERKRRRGWHAR